MPSCDKAQKDTGLLGVVGCSEGVMYLTSPGRPTGLQLSKACYPSR